MSKVIKISSCFLAFFAGLTSAYSGAIVSHILTHDADELAFFSFLVASIFTGFIWITLSKGWGKTLTDLATIIIATLLLTTILIAIIAFSPENDQGLNVALGADFTVLGSLGVIVEIVNTSLAIALAKVAFRNYFIPIISITFLLGAIIGALFGVREMSGFFVAGVVALITLSLGIYVGLQTMKGNQKYEFIYWLTTTITMIGSTELRRNEQPIKLHDKVIEKEYLEHFSQELSQIYDQLKDLSPQDFGDKSDESNPTIRILKDLLEKAIESPKNYIQTEGKIDMTQGKGNVSISGTQGNISGVATAGENQTFTGVALGEISGNVTNSINQLPEVSDSGQPNIKELLTELQTAIENEADLDEDDKTQALEQVKTIAEAAQNPQDSRMQKLAKRAKNTLKGIVASLPTATKLVEEVNNLLPTILKIFGL